MNHSCFELLSLCLCCAIFVTRGEDVNVALNKSYRQINKQISQGPSSRAANGDTSGNYPSNCIHTTLYNGGYLVSNPWWEVDLGRTFPVNRIVVWARDNLNNRLYPSAITVDSQLCAWIQSIPNYARQKEVTCSAVMYGQTVRITRSGNDQTLNLCEMQIWVPSEVSECPVGTYGSSCNSQCSQHCGKGPGKNFCSKDTGYCYDGCVAGRFGDQCSIPCNVGCQQGCDRVTARCSPCKTGYTGNYCNQCQDTYHKNSDGTCVRCSTNCPFQRCDSQTGKCSGCNDGYHGDQCDSNCWPGNCRRCDQDTGQCTECAVNSNLKAPGCTECQDTYYKNNYGTCVRCSSSCLSQKCDSQTGKCDGCNDGYHGDQCDRRCQPAGLCQQCDQDTGQCTECTLGSNLKAPDCTECRDTYYKNYGTCVSCSYNCKSQRCDSQTGKCDGCNDGYHGDQCDRRCPRASICRQCDQDTGQCTECTLISNLKAPDCTDCLDNYYKTQGYTVCYKCAGTCQSGTVCDQATGFCPVCPPGKQGNYCRLDCNQGWYGQNCTEQCGNCRNNAGYCDTVTGECASGCENGWQPPLCKKECEDGSWGADCSKTCGQCKDGAVCDKVDGQCPLCEPGWMPPLCDTQCQDGWYGENCMYQCGSCSNDAPCNKTTGLCTCAIGKQPPFCETDCQDKTYGQDCVHSCGQCKGGQTCDPVTGHCSDGCQPGWTDTPSSPTTLCQTECPDGFYGEGCNQTCANCRDISECRHDTGQCTGQCAEGFTGLYCAEAIKAGGIDAPVIAGAVAAGVIVIAIAIFITIFLIRRRKQAPKPNEMPNSVADRGQREELDSSLLAFQPPVRNNTIDAKPVALVKPVAKPAVKPKPSQANAAVYENVSLPQQTSAPKPSPLDQSGAGGPPQKSPKPLPGAERPLLASREPVTEDEEMDAEWSGEQIYNNDPSLLDSFVPATFRLDQLQKTILDSLQDDTVDAEFEHLAREKEYPVANGKKQENYYKNRFNSILPYDKTRVVLEQVDSDDASDYINASFIKGYKTEKAYIAAQGPRSNTQDDFWRMVWQEGVTDIVMLTNLKEGSKQKCHEYWPARGTSVNTGHMEVTGLEEEERAHFVIRTFNVGKNQGQEKRQVRQYHYVKWMDHEVPTTTPLVDFWRYVRARAPRTPTAPPLLVHCSAGVGRTGTYIALDILMDQSQEEDTISLYTTVSNLRDYRCHMVQNKGQYEFLHEAVLEAYMSGDSRLDTSSFDRIFPSTIRHDQPQPRIDAEFKRLCQMRTCLTHPSHTLASQEENQAKNRNPDALPDDNHIVYITRPSKGRNQYINAVYIPTFLSARGSIVTQLPLADTVIDLWRLVDSWDVTTIVSLGQVKGHKDTSGCYWPVPDSPAVTCGDYTIILKSCSTLGDSLVTYTVDMKKQDKSHEVRVLHYEAWTGEVADNVPDLLCLLDILHTSHKEPTKQPVIIQCLDGVARSGVVCALWDVISRMTYDGEADVYLAVRHVHTVRPEAITSVMQYRFIYQVVKHHLDSYNVYANT